MSETKCPTCDRPTKGTVVGGRYFLNCPSCTAEAAKRAIEALARKETPRLGCAKCGAFRTRYDSAGARRCADCGEERES